MSIFMRFFHYYENYLGCNSLHHIPTNIFSCNQRNEPLNLEFIQYLIATNRNGRLIFSIAPQFYSEFCEHISSPYTKIDDEELVKELHAFFSSKLAAYSVRKMYRLTVGTSSTSSQREQVPVRPLTVTDKSIFLRTGQKAYNKSYKERKWQIKEKLIREGRVFVAIKDEAIISWAEISDINFNGGNIVVTTAPACRKSGYGRLVAAEAVRWCLNNDIVPVYWVDSLNIPSVRLAQSLEFKLMSEELVISIKKNID